MNKKTAPGNRGRYFLIGAVIVLTLLVVKQPSFLKSAYDLLREEALIIGDSSRNDLSQAEKILSAKAGEKPSSFSWKYKGRGYALDESLYESYYRFYKTLPVSSPANDASQVKWYTTYNEMFIAGAVGDDTIQVLAEKIRVLGEERKLNENQMVELVAAFVQTIPYDQGKLERRKSGLDGVTEKITYPYEVLYENTGVCQDKSYLAYALLKKLGYGVAIFLFPDPRDNHMAVGVKCPLQYSNYDSGYCFLETTSLGNRIGVVPDLIPQSRIATSDIAIASFASDQPETEYEPLGRVEILNTVEGKEYTGIIQTISMERELASLKKTLNTQSSRLTALNADIAGEQAELDALEKKLKSLSKDERYDEYNDLVPKYNKKLSAMKKDIKAYNADVAAYNRMADRYNTVKNTLYR